MAGARIFSSLFSIAGVSLAFPLAFLCVLVVLCSFFACRLCCLRLFRRAALSFENPCFWFPVQMNHSDANYPNGEESPRTCFPPTSCFRDWSTMEAVLNNSFQFSHKRFVSRMKKVVCFSSCETGAHVCRKVLFEQPKVPWPFPTYVSPLHSVPLRCCKIIRLGASVDGILSNFRSE